MQRARARRARLRDTVKVRRAEVPREGAGAQPDDVLLRRERADREQAAGQNEAARAAGGVVRALGM